MNEILRTLPEIAGALAEPATRHAAIVHFPVVLACLAPLVILGAMFEPRDRRTLRLASVALLAMLTLTAWLAAWSGRAAADRVGDIPAVAASALRTHADLGARLWIVALVGTILGAVSLVRAHKPALAGAGGALCVALALALWTGAAAHRGGTLVYAYGLGTPKPVTAADLRPDDARAEGDPRTRHFLAEVRPVLADRCMGCHRPGRAEGGLVLTSMASILLGGERGPVITPGNPQTSTLYTTVSGLHPRLRMPKTGRPLTPEQIEAIRVWIERGAVWHD